MMDCDLIPFFCKRKTSQIKYSSLFSHFNPPVIISIFLMLFRGFNVVHIYTACACPDCRAKDYVYELQMECFGLK